MKKLLISAITALAFLFGFASCSGDLHDAEIIDLTGYCIIGSVLESDWQPNGKAPLVYNDAEGTYSVSVTATATGSSAGGTGDTFAIIQEGDTSWATAYRLAQPKSEGDAANVFEATGGTQKVYQGQAADCMLIPATESGDKINIVVKPFTTYIEVTVTVEKGNGSTPALPTPYYLDGLYLVGGCFKVGSMESVWQFGADNLIWGATTEKATGIVTYTKDITATSTSGEMGINDSNWNNKLMGDGVTVKADGKEYPLNGEKDGNFKVEGLTANAPYRVHITTTPEKEVSIKLEMICEYTLTFKMIGLTEGAKGWINGSAWGSSWPNGWPMTSWNNPPNNDLKNAIPEADSEGNLSFGDVWNVTNVTAPGSDLNFEIKPLALTSGDWDDADAVIAGSSADNTPLVIENVQNGTYIVTIDMSEDTPSVEVTKQ